MSRIARIVVPGLPQQVTQRGNHRAPMFFEDGDYRLYRDLLAATPTPKAIRVQSVLRRSAVL